jgi:hypothetical protein
MKMVKKSPALGGTPGLTIKHTTARGKTVVTVDVKFTLFRIIVKRKTWLKMRQNGRTQASIQESLMFAWKNNEFR